MEMQIIDFFQQYGWQLTLIALSGIVVLGLLKSFKVFEKIDSKYRKYVYISISVVLSILGCTAYLLITHTFTWTGFGVISTAVFSLNQVVYSVYENSGIRVGWKALLALIWKLFRGTITGLLGKVLTAEQLAKVVDSINIRAEKAAKKAEIAAAKSAEKTIEQ